MATLESTKTFPRRGEVWWVTFDPALGTEIKKCRPAIVISNDISNQYLDRLQVVPLTSNISKVYASECLVKLSRQTGKAMADQVRTISSVRLVSKIEKLKSGDLLAVEQVLRLQLSL